jgi:hypothetical protein
MLDGDRAPSAPYEPADAGLLRQGLGHDLFMRPPWDNGRAFHS